MKKLADTQLVNVNRLDFYTLTVLIFPGNQYYNTLSEYSLLSGTSPLRNIVYYSGFFITLAFSFPKSKKIIMPLVSILFILPLALFYIAHLLEKKIFENFKLCMCYSYIAFLS